MRIAHLLLLAIGYGSAVYTSATFATLGQDRKLVHSGEETAIVRGPSPRLDGLYYQYRQMDTPLRGNLVVSDTLLPSDAWRTWDRKSTKRYDVRRQTPENYHQSHNHHQSLLSEVINATPGANGIPFWGDGTAAVRGANVWGGFFSARSSCSKADVIGNYLPKGIDRGCGPDFDAQLTGLEVDVLNAGKPGIYPHKAKHGVQVVGFGNPNGQALSVIAENFDREPQYRRGQFESILYAQNSLHPDYGRFIVMDFEQGKIGLDMRKPVFSQGAVDFRSAGVGTGILLTSGKSGEIYGGLRWPDFADPNEWLSIRLGTGGLRIVSHDNTRELMAFDNHGGIYLNGDVYFNGRKYIAGAPADSLHLSWKTALTGFLILTTLVLIGNYFLVQFLVRTALAKTGLGSNPQSPPPTSIQPSN